MDDLKFTKKNGLDTKVIVTIIVIISLLVVGILGVSIAIITKMDLSFQSSKKIEENLKLNENKNNIFKYDYNLGEIENKNIYEIEKTEAYIFFNETLEKFGAVNESGDIIIEPIYDELEQFSDGLTIGNIYDTDGYDRYLKSGYINKNGEIVIDTKSKGLEPNTNFNYGLASVSNENYNQLLIDKDGKVLSKEYQSIRKLDYGYWQGDNFDNSISIINSEGKEIKNVENFDTIEAVNNRIISCDTGWKKYFYDTKEDSLEKVNYEYVISASDNVALVRPKEGIFSWLSDSEYIYGSLIDSKGRELELKDGYSIISSTRGKEELLLIEGDKEYLITDYKGNIQLSLTKKDGFYSIQFVGDWISYESFEASEIYDFEGNLIKKIEDKNESVMEVTDNFIRTSIGDSDRKYRVYNKDFEMILECETTAYIQLLENFIVIQGEDEISDIYNKKGEKINKESMHGNINEIGNTLLIGTSYDESSNMVYINSEGKILPYYMK